ncbi:hypothetical protein QZH41_019809 [Actinostola sp. cb2023]|nr:hypothetical protein QZH41_019809 [Actinostola sp. cb2023]
MVASGEYNLGVPVLETNYTIIAVKKDGTGLEKREKKIAARKYPLSDIRKESMQKHQDLTRFRTDEEYQGMTKEDLKERLLELNEHSNVNLADEEQMRTILKKRERERNWLIWHDHSGMGNQGLMLFLVRELYDPCIHLTNKEYQANTGLTVKVQSIIEEPKLYMMGRSGGSDSDQLAFIPTRRECLRGLSQPIEVNGTEIFDKMRFMNGDNPSVEFEDGTQKGGHRGCCGCDGDIRRADEYDYMSYRRYKSLEEKNTIVLSGPSGKTGGIHPFKNLKVNDIRKELRARGKDDTGLKPELQERLTDILGGTTRVPALLYGDINLTLPGLNLENYEVLYFEPLHCCLNHIAHILDELPHHITDLDTLVLLKETISVSLNKEKLRCTDYRRALLQVTIFLSQQANLAENVRDLLTTFCEMMGIYYGYEEDRNPRQVLRLYNLAIKHSIAYKDVLSPPQTMTTRKMFGLYYHSIVEHAPFIYRLVCLRSINAELFERFFDKIEDITRKTWDKHTENLIPNAFLHVEAEKAHEEENNMMGSQERELTKLANHLPQTKNTVFSQRFLTKSSRIWQAHLQKISDYLEVGEVWWHWNDDGSVEFLDSPSEDECRRCGPHLYPFRSHTIKRVQQHLDNIWLQCCDNPEALPLYKFRNESGQITFNRGKDLSSTTDVDVDEMSDNGENEVQEPTCTDYDNDHNESNREDCTPAEDEDEDECVYFETMEDLTVSATIIPATSCTSPSLEVENNNHNSEVTLIEQQSSPGSTTTCIKDVPKGSKTTKALEVILGHSDEVAEFDRLRYSLSQNPKSRYIIHRYETHLAKIQINVLKAVNQYQQEVKEWDKEFFQKNNRIASEKDYSNCVEISKILCQLKVANKLLERWKITVHL